MASALSDCIGDEFEQRWLMYRRIQGRSSPRCSSLDLVLPRLSITRTKVDLSRITETL